MVSKLVKKIKTNDISKIKICLFAILFLFTFQITMPRLSAEADVKSNNNTNKGIVTTNDGKLTLTKKAEQVGENEYKITLKVEGKVEDPPNVNIALMLDTSKSMSDKTNYIMTALNNFCDTLINKKVNLNVNMALGTFSLNNNINYGEIDKEEASIMDIVIGGKYYGWRYEASNSADSNIITNGFESLQTIKQIISQPSIINIGGGTNTQAGIWRLGNMLDMLKSSSLTDKKYAILFTDGLPTAASGMNCKGEYSLEKYFDAAKNEYTKVVGKVNKFYTAGIFTNTSEADIKKGKEFLSQIQNVTDSENYKKLYFSKLATSADTIFKEISANIIRDSAMAIAKNAIITDKLDSNFVMPSKENLKITGIDKDKVNVDLTNGSITFNIGDILDSSIEVSFIVNAKDPYYCSNDLPTNEKATITYDDAKTLKKITSEFGIPKVDIQPKVGTLSFEKKIDKMINENDTFTIILQGDKGKYVAELGGNSVTSSDFYLRNENTDITNHYDTTKGFLVAGEYSVTEIVPMNYKQIKIEVSFDQGKTFRELGKDEKFTIDYKYPNVLIRATNEISNTNYWWDNEKIYNYFPYTEAS